MASPKPGPEGPSDRLVRALRGFTNEMEAYISGAGKEADMHRTDMHALAVVMDRGRQGERTTPRQLSAALQLSAPATSAVLDRLEQLGHVRRLPHELDRRSVIVEITDNALAVGGAMFARLSAEMRPVLDEHDDAELERLTALVEDLVEAVRRARAATGEG